VLCKAKLQTIRALRKDRRAPRAGERFIAYTGMRTKGCRRLFESVITRVQVIRMEWSPGTGIIAIYVDRRRLSGHGKTRLARSDGFATAGDMERFFVKTHGLGPGKPFCGHIIHWSREYLTTESTEIAKGEA